MTSQPCDMAAAAILPNARGVILIVVFIKFYFVELLRRLFFYKIEFLSIVKFDFVKLFLIL